MVKTTTDVLDINPLERMSKLEEVSTEKKNTIASKKKELEEFEKTKKKELEDLEKKRSKELEEFEKKKKKELDDLESKRKELKDLEDKKLKEITETEELIEQSFQDLMRHKRILLKEEEDKNEIRRKNSSDSEINLEEVAKSAPKNIIPSGANYGNFFEKLQTPQRLYDVTNKNFYEGLKDLRNKVASGEITPEEEMFIGKLRSQFEDFNKQEDYRNQDQNAYVKRSLNILGQIDKYQKLKVD